MAEPLDDDAGTTEQIALWLRVEQGCQQISEAINDFGSNLNVNGKGEADDLTSIYALLQLRLSYILVEMRNVELDHHLRCELAAEDDTENYVLKQKLAKHITRFMRERSLHLYVSDDQPQCTIYAIATRDGAGRYTFENRITKKRFGYYKSLVDLLPLRCIEYIDGKKSGLTFEFGKWIAVISAAARILKNVDAGVVNDMEKQLTGVGRVLQETNSEVIDKITYELVAGAHTAQKSDTEVINWMEQAVSAAAQATTKGVAKVAKAAVKSARQKNAIRAALELERRRHDDKQPSDEKGPGDSSDASES